MEKISVIIPVYNVAPYLEKCLNSVKNQTYQNLEVLCVDDGSTDGSGEILDRFATEDSRFKVFHQKNAGIAAARNLALAHVTGTYVGFVDSDDWIEAQMLEELYGALVNSQADIATCGYFFDKENEINVARNKKTVREGKIAAKDFLKYIYERDTYKGVASYVWTRLFRAEIFHANKERAALTFERRLETCEDIYFVAQCHMRSGFVVYVAKPLYHYVQRPTSIMHQPEIGLKTLSTCRAYEMMIDLFEEEGVSNKIIDLLKRFYVYHASVLLKTAYQVNDIEKIEVLKKMMRKYLGTYIKTNVQHPRRVVEIIRLLRNKNI